MLYNKYNEKIEEYNEYLIPKVGYVCFFHPFEEGANKSLEIYKKGKLLLNKLKIEIIESNEPISDDSKVREIAELFRLKNIDAIIVRLATWCSDSLILDLTSIIELPVINWAVEDINSGSMCGAQQFNAILKELNKNSIFVYKDTDESLSKIEKYIYSASIYKRIKNLRIGIVGNRTQGMSEVICDEFGLKDIFGLRVISINPEKFFEKSKSIEVHENDEKLNFIKNEIQEISVKHEDLLESLRNYYALKFYIEQYGLNAITVDCYPYYLGKFCLAFSLLSSENIACACESDINSAILIWIMQNLSKQPVNHIDPLYIYEEDNSIIGSHCGSTSFLLAESEDLISLKNVRLAHQGVCVQFPSKPGVVTMANFIGRKGTFRMAIINGETIKTKMDFPGTPIRIQFPFPIQRFLDLVELGGFGHHWVVCYGNISNELLQICEFFGIDAIYFNNQ